MNAIYPTTNICTKSKLTLTSQVTSQGIILDINPSTLLIIANRFVVSSQQNGKSYSKAKNN